MMNDGDEMKCKGCGGYEVKTVERDRKHPRWRYMRCKMCKYAYWYERVD